MHSTAWQMHQDDDTRLRAFLYGPAGDALPSELTETEMIAADEEYEDRQGIYAADGFGQAFRR